MKLRSGQVCAAYVPLPDEEGNGWIITRIEKTLPNGDYVVRDEYSESKQFEQYVVKPYHITHFPATNTEKYREGEQVLALWYNEENNEWSTMFYEAKVVDTQNSKIKIQFNGSNIRVETDETKLARLPPDFDMQNGPKSDTKEEEPKKESPPKGEEEMPPRRIYFTCGPIKETIPKVDRITDEQLTAMMEPNVPIKRLKSVEGTPLIDLLEEPELFPQEAPHVMVSGSMKIQYPVKAKQDESELLSGDKKVGRLTRIFNEWRK